MVKRSVLVITPNSNRFKVLESVLGREFEVLHAKQGVLALAVIGSVRPWSVVIEHIPKKADSAAVARSLKLKLAGSRCNFLIYEVKEKLEQPGLRKPFAADFITAAYEGPEAPTQMLMNKLRELRDAPSSFDTPLGPISRQGAPVPRPNKRSTPRPRPRVTPRPQAARPATPVRSAKPAVTKSQGANAVDESDVTWGELLKSEANTENVRALMRKEISLAGRSEADMDDVSWKELLKRPVSVQNIRTLLSKDLLTDVVQDDDGPSEEDDASWSRLLTSDVSVKSLRSILTKPIFGRRKKKSDS